MVPVPDCRLRLRSVQGRLCLVASAPVRQGTPQAHPKRKVDPARLPRLPTASVREERPRGVGTRLGTNAEETVGATRV